MLTIALPKGRIMEEAGELLVKAGLISEAVKEGRKLIIERPEDGLNFILAKPTDVPVYVHYGVADIGIVGKDVLLESEENLYELMDLKIALCRLSLCGQEGKNGRIWGQMPKVATKYPRMASSYFQEKGRQVEIIKLNGSVELAPILGLSDFIVDIVSTGQTLKENGLSELEKIADISSRLIANQATYHLKNTEIEDFITKLEVVLS